MISKKEAIAQQQHFMSIMDMQLAWLKEQADMYAVDLDYNGKDFDDIEYLIDKMSEDVPSEDHEKLYVAIARYLGEDFRRNYGGEWIVDLEENSPYYATPVIDDFPPVEGVLFPPLFLVEAYAMRKEKGFIKQAVDTYINPKPFDLNDIAIEE